MALEDLTGTSKYINNLVNTNPDGATDPKSQGDDHIRGTKNVLLNTFPNITGAMTSTHTELNVLDGIPATLTATELGYVDGVTSAIQTQLDAKQPLDADLTAIAALANTDSNFIVGNGSAWVAESGATARTSLGLGALAVENSISQALLDADSVGQSEVKTTYQSITNNASTYFTATGGIYVIGHLIGKDTTGTYVSVERKSDDNTLNSEYYLTKDGGNACDVRLYYINASPPYNLGDGDIPMFVYAIMNSSGEITGFSSSVDPIWAYNGKTNITPSRYGKDGKVYRKRKVVDFPLTLEQSKQAGRLNEYLAAYREAVEVEEEITQVLKNADMNDIPHPFLRSDLTGKTVVLLDPMSPVMLDLLELQDHDQGDIAEIINGGYLKVGNANLNRRGPSGLLIPSVSWK